MTERAGRSAGADGPREPAASGDLSADERRRAVRERYAELATADGCCGPGGAADADAATLAARAGYDETDLADAGEANLGLSCGNPAAIAALEPGERVLDLGAGAGFDCFLAARAVGPDGRVIGVDMTPEMIDRARTLADERDADNVEFRLGEIEHLPVADGCIDVVISNCVVNLSPAKDRVFREAFRVLTPGGRLAIADVVKTAALPEDVVVDPEMYSRCAAGAETVETVDRLLRDAGFVDVVVEPEDDSVDLIREWDDELPLENFLVSATIEAAKLGP